MLGRGRIICQNSSKNKTRQYITLIVMFILSVCMYVLDYYYLKTDKGLPRFVLITCLSISGFIIWQRQYRKIEIVGTCGIAKYIKKNIFYVTDVKISYYGRVSLLKDDDFGVEFKKYKKLIFHVAETDENFSLIKGVINSPPKSYVVEPEVEKKYRKKGWKILKSSYEYKSLLKYGQEIKNAEIVGGMDLHFGKVIPIYEFTDKKGKHMTWGIKKIKLSEMKNRLHKKCSIYYAPNKIAGILEKVK